jgi:hypothetical protein
MQLRHTKCGNPPYSFVYKFEYYRQSLFTVRCAFYRLL